MTNIEPALKIILLLVTIGYTIHKWYQLVKKRKISNMISKHISYNEAIRSSTATRKGIENIPDEYQLGKYVFSC
jgi:(2Fe-2S) ferredoxin